MAHAIGRLLGFVSYLLGIATAFLWCVMWWGAVERGYAASPTGGHDLWFAIQFDLGGSLFAGFAVYWLMRKVANLLQDKPRPAVSPVDIIAFSSSMFMPDWPENTHLSPMAIGIRIWLVRASAVVKLVVRRVRRTVR